MTVAFEVVTPFSLYTAILGRSWIHAMGVVPSTLHVKVNFHIEQGIAIVRESQQATRQCLLAVVNWKQKQTKQNETVEEVPL